MELVDGLEKRRRSTTPPRSVLLAKAGIPERMPEPSDDAGEHGPPPARVVLVEIDTAGRIELRRADLRRERGIPAQADELPAPHPDLRRAAAELPRPARCGWPSSARSIATSSRASCRA